MRWVFGVLTCGAMATGAGCGSSDHDKPADAAVAIDAQVIDTPPDAPACEKTLLVGGMDVAAQGWQTIQLQPATITYGADYTQLATSTNSGAQSGGQLLLAHPATFASDEAFKLEVVLQAAAINPHVDDSLDAAVAIMGSLTGSVGDQTERSEMVSIYANRITWADNKQNFTVSLIDGTFHSLVLAVDASRKATLSLDGTVVLMRDNFVTNGTIAIGDQSNDAGLDATTQIRSVRQLCVD